MGDAHGLERDEAENAIRAVFADAGVRGWLHARPLGAESDELGRREVSVDPDDAVVMASVYKIIVLLAWCRAVDAGALDPREPLACPVAGRTAGPTGLSVLADDATISARDLVTLMITVSDNAAADRVISTLDDGALDRTIAAAGLTRTRIVGGDAVVHRMLVDDTVTADVAGAFRAIADDGAPVSVRALDPAFGSATTPREITELLAALQSARLTTPATARWALSLMSRQIWPHRLRAGFPETVTIAGKTGTLGPLRNEVGVVTYPGEHPVAVAVFTHAARAGGHVPRADAAIARAARIAVGVLRSGRVTP